MPLTTPHVDALAVTTIPNASMIWKKCVPRYWRAKDKASLPKRRYE
jgi:hypothetical protein